MNLFLSLCPHSRPGSLLLKEKRKKERGRRKKKKKKKKKDQVCILHYDSTDNNDVIIIDTYIYIIVYNENLSPCAVRSVICVLRVCTYVTYRPYFASVSIIRSRYTKKRHETHDEPPFN